MFAKVNVFCTLEADALLQILYIKYFKVPIMRLRARDHYTSSTRVGGKGGAGPSSLHTTLDGTTEYVNICEMDVKFTWMDSYMASNG